MPSSSRLLFWLCVFKFIIVTAESKDDLTSLPRLLEVDVVFPRNDTYRPIFPFPIVVAVRGAPATVHHGLDVLLDLGPVGMAGRPVGRLDLEPDDLVMATDPYYIIDEDIHLINSTSPHWQLHWRFLLDPNCTATPDDPTAQNNYTEFEGSIHFTLGDEGKLPDIVSSDNSCPAPIASFNVTDMGSYVPRNGPNSCLELVDKRPDPCAVKGTASLASKVKSRMERLLCKGEAWPESLRKFSCPMSSAPSTQPILRLFMFSGATALWAMVMEL